jgi:hypothetical protein
VTRVALSLAMGRLTLIRGRLHILDDWRDQFCPPTTVETGRGRQSMGRQLGRFLKTMGAAFGVAPALVMVPVTVASTRGGGSFKRGDSASSGGYGGLAWGKIRTWKGLFIGGK